MNKKLVILGLIVFVFGWVCASFVGSISLEERPMPTVLLDEIVDQPSPNDWIEEKDIFVTDDQVVIKIDNPKWASFTDTNSMDPILDDKTNAIEIVPQYPGQIEVGDIISYHGDYFKGVVIHRVIEKGVDDEGIYFILKGDNNQEPDPGKVRFDQVERVLVAVIY